MSLGARLRGLAALASGLLLASGCASSGGTPEDPARASADRMEGHFPDTALVSHRGEHVRLYRDLLRDHCVLIQFMYTSCDGT